MVKQSKGLVKNAKIGYLQTILEFASCLFAFKLYKFSCPLIYKPKQSKQNEYSKRQEKLQNLLTGILVSGVL